MVWSKSASTCHVLHVRSAHTNTYKSYRIGQDITREEFAFSKQIFSNRQRRSE